MQYSEREYGPSRWVKLMKSCCFPAAAFEGDVFALPDKIRVDAETQGKPRTGARSFPYPSER